jgi:hypothetical protein
VSDKSPTLAELLRLAREDNLVLRTEAGEEFILAELDDFDRELAATRQQQELGDFLDARSREKETLTPPEARRALGLS